MRQVSQEPLVFRVSKVLLVFRAPQAQASKEPLASPELLAQPEFREFRASRESKETLVFKETQV